MEIVIFYCPSKILGGTEILFSRLAINVSRQNLIKKVCILDLTHGILTKLCTDYIKIFKLSSLNEINDSENAIIFVPAKCLHQLYEELQYVNFNGKVCVWQLGSLGLSETLFLPFWLKFRFSKPIYYYVKKVLRVLFLSSFNNSKNLVYKLLTKKALIFTDLIGAFETFNDLDFRRIQTHEIEILPVFVDQEQNLYLNYNHFEGYQLNIGWVGRISNDFKIHSLVCSINSIIENYKNSFIKITFHIIGNGDAFKLIENLKLEIENKYNNIHLILYGELSNKNSIDLILKTSDIAIGMGTASLDVAKFGIPSIIISPITTIKDFNKAKYRWLYDSFGFSTGEFPNSVAISSQNSHNNIKALIDDFILNHKEISKKTHVFIDNYFTTDIALRKFVSFLNNCDYNKFDFVFDFKSIYDNRIFFKKLTKFYNPKWLP